MQLLPYMQSFFNLFKQLAAESAEEMRIEALSATMLQIWSVLNTPQLRDNSNAEDKLSVKSTSGNDFLAYILSFLIEAVQLSF